MKTGNYDVVVVGGGLAGLVAAIESANRGLGVLLVCKSRAGKSGNTLVSGAALSVLNTGAKSGDSAGLLERDLLSSGCGINDPRLCRTFAKESAAAVGMLKEYGAAFKEPGGIPMVKQPPGHSVPRLFPSEYREYPYMNRGLALTLPLVDRAEKLGVAVMNDTAALRILTRQNSVCGLLAWDRRSGEVLHFRTGVVILAAGGGAGLYSMNNNTADVSCDSFGLAYEAGAALRDMEMVQFYPTMMYEPARIPISNPLFGDGAVLRNVDGEEFLFRYSPKGNHATRDLMARAVKREIDEGRGNPRYVFADCSGIPGEVLKLRYGELSAILSRYGLSLEKDLLQIAPSAHFYLGGVVIDRACATSVEGLFACGEAAGGLHGANRLAGVALAEAAVFGNIAGKSAAEYFKKQPPLPLSGMPGEVPDRGMAVSLPGLAAGLREAMWSFASIVRSEVSLKKAAGEIDEVSRELEAGGAGNAEDPARYFALRSMVLTARMLVECSLYRKETRGAFCREEYPDSSREYAGSFVVQKTDTGAMGVSFLPNWS
ncbi:FAD-dependent oxidoreductase [Aminivibrio sp.]|jgi:succinate dehydrogenase/fumarate reductase flavoprotein subunit|uniref:FAD-dependent oxidoreductase n=1 Tax=Aminivibrio sp. TaxID=1872489 RepID=UPI001A3E8D87|nr:FAD-dependent oxidoreductase [Aminivibrio sp.]MBL3540581.1 FAD-dependent oxidoreductase [Aminivibrio sp.]MDK2958790.1 fumarate reductase (CoM/CoB) subunit [Synergistaceae bacterium]MEA4953538.1 FAD-dependent oxidoreductase [Aminivibrio sp.]